jgi:hypothetical protein
MGFFWGICSFGTNRVCGMGEQLLGPKDPVGFFSLVLVC